ncbi:hypothetical protein L9F63_024203, partial [Diploptera punctata]
CKESNQVRCGNVNLLPVTTILVDDTTIAYGRLRLEFSRLVCSPLHLFTPGTNINNSFHLYKSIIL